MTKKNLVVGETNGWLILVHGTREPSNDEWQLYAVALEERVMDFRGQLVLSLGGRPNIAQRSRTIAIGKPRVERDRAQGRPIPRTAVMTSSVLARGLVTAFNWFFDQTFKAFPLDDFNGALTHLGVPEAEQPAVRARAAALFLEVE